MRVMAGGGLTEAVDLHRLIVEVAADRLGVGGPGVAGGEGGRAGVGVRGGGGLVVKRRGGCD